MNVSFPSEHNQCGLLGMLEDSILRSSGFSNPQNASYLAICLSVLIHHKPEHLIPVTLKTTHASSSAFLPWADPASLEMLLQYHLEADPYATCHINPLCFWASLLAVGTQECCFILLFPKPLRFWICESEWWFWTFLLMVKSCQVDAHSIHVLFCKGFQ